MSATKLKFGDFELDVAGYELRRDGQSIKLERIPMELLLLLLNRSGQLVTRDEILEKLWGKDVFLDVDNSINTAISKVRLVLRDHPENPAFIKTVPGKGYRFIAPITPLPEGTFSAVPNSNSSVLAVLTPDSPSTVAEQEQSGDGPTNETGSRLIASVPKSPITLATWKIALPVTLLAVTTIGGLLWRTRQSNRLIEKDKIVLMDFANSTGDPVFDDSLKQGLRAQLEQSPFLNILSDQRMGEELSLMGHAEDERLTPVVARDLCQRVGSKAVLAGTISSIGTHYVIGLSAWNCRSGDTLAYEQVEADSREHVLKALGESARNMRRKLGESLASIQKYDAPLEQVTTTSLEALKAYSLGIKSRSTMGDTPAIPFFRRAVELDPKFAMAYSRLGTYYGNVGEAALSVENLRKAYELRDRVSEGERFYIVSHYYHIGIGDWEKALEVYELWHQTYPQDPISLDNMADIHHGLGKCERALQELKELLRMDPNFLDPYYRLFSVYLCLNRMEEAETALMQAEQRKLGSQVLRATCRYELAFLKRDAVEMEGSIAAAAGSAEPGSNDLVFIRSDTEAYYGHLARARDFWWRAADSARPKAVDVRAALWMTSAALREAEFGNAAAARREAAAALAIGSGPTVEALAALALARAGSVAQAERLTADLSKHFPANTMLQDYWLPAIRAATELSLKNPRRSIELLKPAASYELGQLNLLPEGMMYPVYLRGQAYLLTHQGPEAAAEFQKLIDHPGIVLNFPLGALAHLQLGRAYALQGDTAKARAAYQDFFILWKDGDPDIPILIAAKSEYAKLR